MPDPVADEDFAFQDVRAVPDFGGVSVVDDAGGRPASRAFRRFPCLPRLIDEPIVRFDEPLGAIEIPGFHPKGKQKSLLFLSKPSVAKEAFSFNENRQKL